MIDREIASIFIKAQESVLIKELMENAIPKIKGQLTPGKLKWRGIKLVEKNSPLKITRWIEQRSKPITQKHTIEFKIKE